MVRRRAVLILVVLGFGVADATAHENFRVLAGASPAGHVNGTGGAARFSVPTGIAVDSGGNIYVADRTNQTIRKITAAGNVTTFAGLASTIGSADGTGSAARFSAPQGVAVDAAGTVYVADTNNSTIRTITPGGAVSTLAGLALSTGGADGTGSAARFNLPRGIAVDSAGTLYIADTNNHTIRKIAPGGVVTTLAGLAGTSGNSDGTGSAARFNQPRGIAVDIAGTVYVADFNNALIRKVTPGGVVTTLAGTAGAFGWSDGTGSAARFGGPSGIAVDNASGSLYVADTNTNTIREITADGVVTTHGGCPFCIGTEDSGMFSDPQGIAMSARGSLYVADTGNNTIRTDAPMTPSLVVDFGSQYGIWIRRGDEWSQLNPYTAEAMIRIAAGDHDNLVIDFGPGVGLWMRVKEADEPEVWFQLHTQSPTAMAAVDFDGDGDGETVVFDFPGHGVWVYDSYTDSWWQLHTVNARHLVATDLDGDGTQEIIIDFPGYGLWIWSYYTGWAQLHPFDVTSMVVADLDGNRRSDLVMNFPGYGVWAYMNGTTWVSIHPFEAKRLAAGDLDGNGMSDLIVDFDTAYGVWIRHNGTTWTQLHNQTTEGITTGDVSGNGHDEVIIDFSALGIWSFEDLAGWRPVHGAKSTAMTTGRLN